MWYSSRANLQIQYSVALYPLLLACWTRSVYLAAWGGGGETQTRRGRERHREGEREKGRETHSLSLSLSSSPSKRVLTCFRCANQLGSCPDSTHSRGQEMMAQASPSIATDTPSPCGWRGCTHRHVFSSGHVHPRPAGNVNRDSCLYGCLYGSYTYDVV